MPPKKRAKASQALSPDATSLPKTPTPAAEAANPENNPDTNDEGNNNDEPEKEIDPTLVDPWTDEEEIGLFKGIMRWKPTGIHKHFRIVALHNWLLENRYIDPDNAHTRPAGIRAKLATLYNLESLDAREDARQLSKLENPLLVDAKDSPANGGDGATAAAAAAEDDGDDDDDDDAYSEAANKIESGDFALPHGEDHEFAEMMWRRRYQDARGQTRRSGSPLGMTDLNLAQEAPVHFTPRQSIDPSETTVSVSRRGRGRATRGRDGRVSGVAAGPGRRRSARRAESMGGDEAENQQEQEEEEGDEEEEEEDDEDDEEASGDEEQSKESTPAASRSTRGNRGRRGRAAQSSSAQASRRTRKRQR